MIASIEKCYPIHNLVYCDSPICHGAPIEEFWSTPDGKIVFCELHKKPYTPKKRKTSDIPYELQSAGTLPPALKSGGSNFEELLRSEMNLKSSYHTKIINISSEESGGKVWENYRQFTVAIFEEESQNKYKTLVMAIFQVYDQNYVNQNRPCNAGTLYLAYLESIGKQNKIVSKLIVSVVKVLVDQLGVKTFQIWASSNFPGDDYILFSSHLRRLNGHPNDVTKGEKILQSLYGDTLVESLQEVDLLESQLSIGQMITKKYLQYCKDKTLELFQNDADTTNLRCSLTGNNLFVNFYKDMNSILEITFSFPYEQEFYDSGGVNTIVVSAVKTSLPMITIKCLSYSFNLEKNKNYSPTAIYYFSKWLFENDFNCCKKKMSYIKCSKDGLSIQTPFGMFDGDFYLLKLCSLSDKKKVNKDKSFLDRNNIAHLLGYTDLTYNSYLYVLKNNENKSLCCNDLFLPELYPHMDRKSILNIIKKNLTGFASDKSNLLATSIIFKYMMDKNQFYHLRCAHCFNLVNDSFLKCKVCFGDICQTEECFNNSTPCCTECLKK